MKVLNKALVTSAIVAGMFMSSVLPVSADSSGTIEGGPIYKIKNLTQNLNYNNPQTANACDEVEYSVQLHNTGWDNATNIVVNATLPSTSGTSNTSTITATYTGGDTPNVTANATLNLTSAQTVTYENGSAELLNSTGGLVKALPDGITGQGVNIGTLPGSTIEYVNFKANIGCPKPTPVYTCDSLTVTAGDNKTVTVSALNTTAQNGATFNNATINWGDNTTPTTVSNVAGVTHTYAAAGNYTIAATANFTVNGQTQTATSNACKQAVTFSSTTPPTVTPTTPTAAPTQLVNTGAGDTVGIFAAVVAISTIAYRFVLGRRLSRQ